MSSDSEIRFADLGLAPRILKAISGLGYETPSAIQAEAIPPLLEGRDLIGQAQTGTGKTAAFSLPLLQRLNLKRRDVQAIVLTPTRELAIQVAESVRAYGKYVGKHGVQVLPVYGGQPIHIQRRALERTVHVVIGTPGRVSDHLRRGTLDLSGVHFFCLDEADEMLNMGFQEDVEWILDHAPEERQVALFSATLPPPIRRIASQYLSNPADVRIEVESRTVEGIEQFGIRVARHNKKEALERVLGVEDHEAVLIFVGTQRAAAELAEYLSARGFGADCIHGGMNQGQRDHVVKRLRARRIQIVVGTDVAARGLDVDHIGLVINYDLPRDPEVYVHRIGRTGRAGRAGKAISLWQHREQGLLRAIERFGGQKIQRMDIPGAEELLARQRDRMLKQLVEAGAEAAPEFKDWAKEILEEGDLADPLRLAAAALRVAWGEGPLRAPERPGGPGDPTEFVQIVLRVGARDRIRPGTIVGTIAGESGLGGHVVGRINVCERVTFVDVAAEHARDILAALSNVRIGGRHASARMAHPQSEEGPRPRPPKKPHRKGAPRKAPPRKRRKP